MPAVLAALLAFVQEHCCCGELQNRGLI